MEGDPRGGFTPGLWSLVSSCTLMRKEEQFTCSICLDIFSNPVSTPCGHSFCSSCISSYWEGQGGKNCFCPLCKENFRKRPELHINHTLKEITEQFKRMAETTISPPKPATADLTNNPFSAKPGAQQRQVELPRGLLQEMRTRMQRTPTSSEFMPSHDPQPLPPTKIPKRNFSVSTAGSNGPLCPRHGYGLELICKTDQMCICAVCAEQEHYGHSVMEAKREMNIKKSQLRILEVEIQGLITVRERKIEEIQSSLAEIQVNAEREKAGTVTMFSELVKSLEKSQAELLEVVEMGRRAAELRSQTFISELQEEITDLKNRCSTINVLTKNQDPLTFFKTYSGHTNLPMTKSWAEVVLTPEPIAGAVQRNVSQLVEEVQRGLSRLSEIRLNPPTERPPEIYQYQQLDVTLDRDSAHPRLIISEDGKQVHCSDRYQMVPDTLERFDRVVCVLGRQGISTGCHHWEVVVGEKTDWDLGIASRSINRKGKIAANPANGFWFLSLRDKFEYVFRTEPATPIVVTPKPNRIGMYVDYEKGLLSFYNADTKSVIFTYTDSFSETLFPFFSPCTNKSGKNEAPLAICPVFPVDPSWLEYDEEEDDDATTKNLIQPCTPHPGECLLLSHDLTLMPTIIPGLPWPYVDMATGRKSSTSKGGVRFPDEEEEAPVTNSSDEKLQETVISAVPEPDGAYLVKAGFLRSHHKYEIVFSLPHVPTLGKDVTLSPALRATAKPRLRATRITPRTEGGVRVVCEYSAQQEGVVQEELTLVNRSRRDSSVRVRLQARVMERHHGTPLLLDGVRCVGEEKHTK
ncbi:hypothetical protein DNTS_020817 [Danionella cerebrum]|uniref:Uncharacterized protein n=1 Tax=Danionella cerebrum TaxID=2873325 RepID=A0A553RBE3_9TELE|nr:hypothetical protein DNTS_020817 [Danionella translucida]